MKYRRKPEIVEAVQWWKHGDHQQVVEPSEEQMKLWGIKKRNGILITDDRICSLEPGAWVVLKDGKYYAAGCEAFSAQFEPVGE